MPKPNVRCVGPTNKSISVAKEINYNWKISQNWLDHNSLLGGKYAKTQGAGWREGQLINIGCNLSKIASSVSSFLVTHFYQGHFSFGASYLREIFVCIRIH